MNTETKMKIIDNLMKIDEGILKLVRNGLSTSDKVEWAVLGRYTTDITMLLREVNEPQKINPAAERLKKVKNLSQEAFYLSTQISEANLSELLPDPIQTNKIFQLLNLLHGIYCISSGFEMVEKPKEAANVS